MDRRRFLEVVGASVLAATLPTPTLLAAEEAETADYTVRIGNGLVELSPDHIVSTTLYNGQFPGPLIRFKEGANADHHKKNKDSDALMECTIESSGGGGGCTVGFKRVCQKLKNGNKCCGCVPDKNAKASTLGGATTSQSQSNTSGQGAQTDSKGTLLLPYFECDLTKPGGCKHQK